jgi:flagellar basal body rod protein FlgG
MKSDEIRLNAISQNLANISTPGYKKQIAVASAFSQQLAIAGEAAPSVASLTLDSSAGALRHTGAATDLAIEGGGFFELAGENGPVYTRQASLRVDVQGRLVGAQNLPLMGSTGPVHLANEPYSIGANGDIKQADRVVATIKLVHFDKPGQLAPVGNGMYAIGAAHLDDTPQAIHLRTGFQETSNVNSAQEMVRLTETVRHFESMQKLVQGYDDSLEKAIRKLGEF